MVNTAASVTCTRAQPVLHLTWVGSFCFTCLACGLGHKQLQAQAALPSATACAVLQMQFQQPLNRLWQRQRLQAQAATLLLHEQGVGPKDADWV